MPWILNSLLGLQMGLGVPSLPWQSVLVDCNGSYVVISREGGIEMDSSYVL